MPIGIVDRGRRAGGAGFHDFIAGRKHRDAQPAPHREPRRSLRGGKRQIGGSELPARWQHDGALAEILSRKATVGAALETGRHDDGVAFDPAILLHEHGVGANRHRGAGEDANGLPARERMRRRMSGHHAFRNDQPGVGSSREVGVAHRESIHRRIVEGRQILRRRNIDRNDATERIVQGNLFDLGHRRHTLDDQPLHVGDRQQRAGKRKTVVGELGHHGSSTASARRRASMVSRRSAFARTSWTTPSMSSISTTGRPASGNGVSETMPTT